MAAIRENKKNGKIISYRFTLCLERDAQGKQIRRYTTWTPPEGLTPAKAKKAAERAADAWEDETRRAYQEEQKALACGAAYHLRQRNGMTISAPLLMKSGFRCTSAATASPQQPLITRTLQRSLQTILRAASCRKSAPFRFRSISFICKRSTRHRKASRLRQSLCATTTER